MSQVMILEHCRVKTGAKCISQTGGSRNWSVFYILLHRDLKAQKPEQWIPTQNICYRARRKKMIHKESCIVVRLIHRLIGALFLILSIKSRHVSHKTIGQRKGSQYTRLLICQYSLSYSVSIIMCSLILLLQANFGKKSKNITLNL